MTPVTNPPPNLQHVDTTANAVRLPRRIALIHRSVPAQYVSEEDKMVMTYPHLVVREAIALEILMVALGLLAVFFNAPLESLANPNKTPNPAKAPWYFLGLQELLHYFPPIVAGVLVPTLAVIALVAIPYFRVNLDRQPLWHQRTPAKAFTFLAVCALFTGILVAFQCYLLAVPMALFAAVMVSLYPPPDRGLWKVLVERTPQSKFFTRAHAWLSELSLAVWLMSWFLTAVAALTITGSLFRGPGWSLVWPWK